MSAPIGESIFLGPTRTLFHFTYPDRVDDIVAEGLYVTDIPTSPTRDQGYRGVWLTEDPNPMAQNWASGSPPGLSSKTGARITVDIPHHAIPGMLYRWLALAKAVGVEDYWLEALNQTGGGNHESWYVYISGNVPADSGQQPGIPAEWISFWEILSADSFF
jgi:hypothetical protein